MKKILPILLSVITACSLVQAQDSPTPAPSTNEVSTPPAPAQPEIPAPAPAMVSPEAVNPVAAPTKVEEEGPAAYPTTKKEIKPIPKAIRVIPQRFGDTSGDVFIGHREVVDRYAGWGWIRRENDGWNRSHWAMLEEKPGVLFAPGRYLGNPDSDIGNLYKLYGQWAPYKGYEPNYDVFVDVFQIKGFELIGSGEIPKMSPPRSGRGRTDSDGPYQRRGGTTR